MASQEETIPGMMRDVAGCCSRHGMDCQGPEVCSECHGMKTCNCFVCVQNNKGMCLFCNPTPKVVAWRAGGHKGHIGA